MQVKILFDKDANNKDLYTGWGVSFLADERVLFDTGENGSWLMKNMRALDTTMKTIEAVVISHDHWDHTGGLWEILKIRKGLRVYACPDFSPEFKKRVKDLKGRLIETAKMTKVCSNIFVTGQINGGYKGEYMPEQGLVLRTANGVSLLTGCAHPGIVKMIMKVKEDFPHDRLFAVMGGFHLMDTTDGLINIAVEKCRHMGIKKIGPTHCSGTEAPKVFKEVFGDGFIAIAVGQTITV